MLDLLSWTRACPFVDYEASHISEPLFPGGTSVFWVHTILMPPNLPRFCTAPWSPLRRQNTKANSFQSMTDFTLLNYPPILGEWANDKKMTKIYRWIKRTNSSSPRFLPLFRGILPILPILGGYWPILLSIIGKKWGDKSFMLLIRIIFSQYRPWFNLFILYCRSHSLFRFIEDRSLFQLCVSHLFLFLVFDVII